MNPAFKIILLLLLILFSTTLAQSGLIEVGQIELEQGLSQSSVSSIVQDKYGFMWFGTQDGLNRYDGYSVTVFKHDPADNNSITDNTISSLLGNKKGDLWIGTMGGGLDRYIISENKFIHYRHKDSVQETIAGNFINYLFEDSRGGIWVGTRYNGLDRFEYSTGKFSHIPIIVNGTRVYNGFNVFSIAEDRSGFIWISTSLGLYKMRDSSFILYSHSSKDKSGLPTNFVRALYNDKNGTLWAGLQNYGLCKYYEESNNFKLIIPQPGNNPPGSVQSIYEDLKGNLWLASYDAGLMNYDRDGDSIIHVLKESILSLFVDKSGILWIGTASGGVKTYDYRKILFKHFFDNPNDPNDLSGNDLFAILEDRDGELWVGTDGKGLNRFDKSHHKVKTYTFDKNNKQSISSNRIFALSESSNGNIWIGTIGGGLNCFDKSKGTFKRYLHKPGYNNSLSVNDIMSLHEDSGGMLWIGNTQGGVDVLNISKNTFRHFYPSLKIPDALKGTAVIEIYEDNEGIIWIGTVQGGLHRYVPESDSFKRYISPSYSKSEQTGTDLKNNTVFSIYKDKSGMVWFSVLGGGLNSYDPLTGKGKYYNQKHGLSSDIIYGILPDKSGNLWLSTNNGLSRFNPATGSFKNYYVRDGLQSNEFNQGAYFAGENGELFFGGINGFNSFFPDEIEDNNYLPPVHIINFKVFDKVLPLPNPLPENQKIELSYSQNFFSFEFVALNYTSPEKNQFAYKLDGFDLDWHRVSASQRFASYTNLNPGKYILRIKGSNNDGLWNEKGTYLVLIITPPFWLTWWFFTLSAVLIILIFYLVYKYRINKLIAIERTRLRISQDLHDEVSASITGIVYFAEALGTAIGEKINPSVKKLLELIKENSLDVQESMSDIIWSINPRNDSWSVIFPKLRRYASDLCESKGINYTVNFPNQMDGHSIEMGARHDLWLVFKEILTNAVKHSCCRHIEITLLNNEKYLHLIIKDDGLGFDSNVTNDRNGIRNIYSRVNSLKGKVLLDTSPGKGTKWELQLKF